jgi:opacity protein-like surface antigen
MLALVRWWVSGWWLGAFMKSVALVSVAFGALAAGSAMAADMTPVPGAPAPAPVYSRALMPATTYDWTGFYLGGRVGYSRAKTDSTTINTASGALDAAASTSQSNFHGGAQVGFDYTMPSRLVIGVVADVYTGDDKSTTLSDAGGAVHAEEAKTVASGSLRARVGYAIANVLLYGTGGWAWTDSTATRTQLVGKTGKANPGTIESIPENLNGWTAGAGLAYGFWHNWELFAEYRYTSYGSNSVTFPIAQRSTSSTTTANSIAGGLSFKFDPFITRY